MWRLRHPRHPPRRPRRHWLGAAAGALLAVALATSTVTGQRPPVSDRPVQPRHGVPSHPQSIEDALSPATPMPRTRVLSEWPFSRDSVWNMPLGNGARYRPLEMKRPTTGFSTDEVYVMLDPTANGRHLIDRGYWWPWRSGGSVEGRDTGIQVRVPDGLVIPPPARGTTPNRASAAFQLDNDLIRDFQYTVRPYAGSDLSIFEEPRGAYSLHGDGVVPAEGSSGGHGGSGLPALGGVLRLGELTSPAPIRHALAITMNMQKWGDRSGRGYTWPATATDRRFADEDRGVGYGTLRADGGASPTGVVMGSLLAIPEDVDLQSLDLETVAGAKLAWTHQNYGAYVVDTSVDTGNFDVHRINVDVRVRDEYPAIDTAYTTDTPFGRDMSKIFENLALVENNGPQRVGGGGALRQPLAP